MTRNITTILFGLAVVLASGSGRADIITVNTLVDQVGTGACSLREALYASQNHIPIGGCSAGIGTDTIQLASGTYILNRSIEVSTSVTILGAATTTNNNVDPLTGQLPTRTLPTTTITIATQPLKDSNGNIVKDSQGNPVNVGSDRLFVVDAGYSASFTDLVLTGGYAGAANDLYLHNGGAVWSSGTATFNNVQLVRNTAPGQGGAIFLSGQGTSLTATLSSFNKNLSGSGGSAIGGTCYSASAAETHTLNLSQDLFYGNAAISSPKVLGPAVQSCGDASLTLSNDTFAFNDQAVALTGSNTTLVNVNTASVALNQLTIVGQLDTGLDFSKAVGLGSVTLTNSVVAFNGTASDAFRNCRGPSSLSAATAGSSILNNRTGHGCGLTDGYPSTNTNAEFGQAVTALDGGVFTGSYVRTTLASAGTTVAVDDIRAFQSVPLAVTINGDLYTVTAATADATSVSTAVGGVSGTLTFSNNVTVADGTAGNAVTTSTVNPNFSSLFYLPNPSNPGQFAPPTYGGLTGGFFPRIYKSPHAPSLLIDQTKISCETVDQRGAPRDLDNNGCTIGALEPKKLVPTADSGQNLASAGAARTVTVSVLANDSGDEDGGDGKFNAAGVDGVSVNGTRYVAARVVTPVDCTNLNGGVVAPSVDGSQLIYYPPRRTVTWKGAQVPGPGAVTSTPVVCNYYIQDNKSTPNQSQTFASVTITVADIPPVAVNATYTRPYNGNPFFMTPLIGASDPDGLDGELPPAGPARSSSIFTKLTSDDCSGRQLVQITAKPTLGTVTGNIMAVVVNGSILTNYYDGNLTYTPSNSFSPFGDSFQYQVLDADCQPSNVATVTINTNAPPEGGVGGSFDNFMLAGGLALLLVRRLVAGGRQG